MRARGEAIAKLQAARPGLRVQFTLPVMPSGLDAAALGVLRDAKARGARVDVVNLMVMDYSESLRGDMAAYATQAARAALPQVRAVFPAATLGLTPMLGKNDVRGEVFTLENARELAAFARGASDWVTFVGFWAVGRDRAEASGVAQTPHQFARIFADALDSSAGAKQGAHTAAAKRK